MITFLVLAQVCALVEIGSRCMNAKMSSFVAFIDLRKAYDSVPQEALFVKMEKYGVGPVMMKWLRALYYSSGFRIRCGNNLSNNLSPRVELLRGLRQGCPISPILFDIFANDSLEGARPTGLQVPGITDRVPGLLFADDLAILGGSEADLSTSIQQFETWCNTWEMSVGISKCGIMGFGVISQFDAGRYEDWPTLQGGVIPLVDSYVYLGCKLDFMLRRETAVSHRVSMGRRVLGMVTPFLASRSITLGLKRIVLQAVLIPSMIYGGEWFGMQSALAQKVQKIVNQAVRLCVGLRLTSTWAPIGSLCRELGIRPIHQTLSAKRVRLFQKADELHTVIRELKANPCLQRKDYWSKGVRRWIKTSKVFGVTHMFMNNPIYGLVPLEDVTPTTLKDHMDQTLQQKLIEANKPKGEVRFLNWNMGNTRNWYKLNFNFPNTSVGSQVLVKIRCGAYWTASRYATVGWIPNEYKDKCPMCLVEGTPETIHHMIFDCDKWHGLRQGVRSLLNAARRKVQQAIVDNEDHTGELLNQDPGTFLCCGGTLNQPLEEWKKSLELVSGGILSRRERETKEKGGSDVTQFTLFLGVIHKLRMMKIAQLHKHTTGQSPNGQDGACTAHTQPQVGVG